MPSMTFVFSFELPLMSTESEASLTFIDRERRLGDAELESNIGSESQARRETCKFLGKKLKKIFHKLQK